MSNHRIRTYLLALVLACAAPGIPTEASAEVLIYSTCTLNEGKTLADVDAVFRDWRTLSETEGFGDYKIRILVPHAASNAAQTTFVLEGSAPDFERYGAAFGWWYSDPDAAASNAAMNQVFSCSTQEVWHTTSP